MVGIALTGAFASASTLLLSASARRADVALVDSAGYRREELAEQLDALAGREGPGQVIAMCAGGSEGLSRCSLEHGVQGLLLDCPSPSDLHATIRSVARGQAVLPREWRRCLEAPAQASARLTARQSQVLDLLANGYTNQEIAVRLRITPNTVKAHVSAIYERLGVSNRIQAANRHATLAQDGGRVRS
jgi:DNA-binding NarL/FixJ family response regulator